MGQLWGISPACLAIIFTAEPQNLPPMQACACRFTHPLTSAASRWGGDKYQTEPNQAKLAEHRQRC